MYYLGQGMACKIEFLGTKKKSSTSVHDLLEKETFSKKNISTKQMIPSSASPECQGLMQCEEILIAGAFPMMQVYIKP